jgi:hypothetical protein
MDSPLGGGRTVPRTVSRIALREDPQNSDSPSGGTLEQPHGQKDRTYDLSTGLHTYGVSYPIGLHRPELVPAGTQTAFRIYETLFLGGREKPEMSWHVYESKGWILGSPLTSYL